MRRSCFIIVIALLIVGGSVMAQDRATPKDREYVLDTSFDV